MGIRDNRRAQAGAKTVLNKEVFTIIWVQRSCIDARCKHYRALKRPDEIASLVAQQKKDSHERKPGADPNPRNILDIDRVKVRLRHTPEYLWMTSWVEIASKPLLSDLNNNNSLGPKRLELLPIKMPKLSDMDTDRTEINDVDGRPRYYAILWNVKKKFNEMVKQGDELIEFRVFNERKMTTEMKERGVFAGTENSTQPPPFKPGPDFFVGVVKIVAPASGRFTGLCPAVWKQRTNKERANFLKETRGQVPLFDWKAPKTHGYLDQEWVDKNVGRNPEDLLRNYNLKFFSYETLAFIDQGEEGWSKRLLPVEEWPELFFKEFFYFFVR